ncbi:MAG: hypothetical protein ACXW2Y_00975 [Acidimicrobiia bacterium]
MTATGFVEIDPLFGDGGAAMIELCERFGRYGMYSQEHVDSEIGRGLSQRHDAVLNHLRTGGRRRRDEPIARLAARTNYFREEYAYGTCSLVDGIEPFLFHDGFVEAARAVHGRPVIEPAIVFANFMVPGQELAVHTDVPEFRGANRKLHPQWLLVAMRHSGLFEEHRMPIATGVAWFHDARGGEFASWPDGPTRPGAVRTVTADSALVLDTDSVFHGVEPIDAPDDEIAPLQPGMTLDFVGSRRWAVHGGDATVATYDWSELRFSVSWKAYCFADHAERDAWRDHTDDLDLDATLARLVDDLRARGRIDGAVPPSKELALLIIDEYIRFPVPASTP